jgi:hypothetical protein
MPLKLERISSQVTFGDAGQKEGEAAMQLRENYAKICKVRLLWRCLSRTGNNRCEKARGKKSIGPDFVSLEWLCKSI